MGILEITGLASLIVTPVTGVVSWLAGTRSRKNTAIQEMLKTIQELSKQNADLNKNVIELQEEVIEVRRENAELKANQETMMKKLEAYESSNSKPKKQSTKKS